MTIDNEKGRIDLTTVAETKYFVLFATQLMQGKEYVVYNHLGFKIAEKFIYDGIDLKKGTINCRFIPVMPLEYVEFNYKFNI